MLFVYDSMSVILSFSQILIEIIDHLKYFIENTAIVSLIDNQF